MSKELTAHQAFKAMAQFLHEYAARAGDDLLTLLSDITLDENGHTFDPAAWHDWQQCVAAVLAEDQDTS